VVVFQLYKHYHTEALDIATRMGCSQFDKVEFFTAIESICIQTFKPTTIILSAFRETGLWLFNPDIVLDKLQPIRVPLRQHTPIPGLQLDDLPSTPTTLCLLQYYADSLVSTLPPPSPTSNRHLQQYLKWSLAIPQSTALALQDLENTKAAVWRETISKSCEITQADNLYHRQRLSRKSQWFESR